MEVGAQLNEEQLALLEEQMIQAGLHDQFQQLSDEEKIQLFTQMLQGSYGEEGEYEEGEEQEQEQDGEE